MFLVNFVVKEFYWEKGIDLPPAALKGAKVTKGGIWGDEGKEKTLNVKREM